MRLHELSQFSLGNTDTVDENWELSKEDDENMEDTPSVSSCEENETDEPSYPRIFITCVTSRQMDTQGHSIIPGQLEAALRNGLLTSSP